MYDGVTVLDFDHSYRWQAFLRDQSVEWIDLTDLSGAKRYCGEDTLARIRHRLRRRRRHGVTLIGSGNYHYVTYLLLAEIRKPFTLVLFDYHTDMMEPPDDNVITCGSWVLKALRELPMLRQVIVIGAREGAADMLFRDLHPHLKRRVFVFEPVTEENARRVLPAIISRLSTHDVYISVDKDVLAPTEAITDWEQGTMKLADLMRLIRSIAGRRKLCGADICGEYPVSPVEVYNRRHRLAVRRNARANQMLLEAIRGVDRRSLPLSS